MHTVIDRRSPEKRRSHGLALSFSGLGNIQDLCFLIGGLIVGLVIVTSAVSEKDALRTKGQHPEAQSQSYGTGVGEMLTHEGQRQIVKGLQEAEKLPGGGTVKVASYIIIVAVPMFLGLCASRLWTKWTT
jgi:hypothetical protein